MADEGIIDLCNQVRQANLANDPCPDLNEGQLAHDVAIEIQDKKLKEIEKESRESKESIQITKKLTQLLEKINALKDRNGGFDATNGNDELKALLDEVRALDLNLEKGNDGEHKAEHITEIKENNYKYTPDEAANLKFVLDSRIKDLNTTTKMKMDAMSRNWNLYTEGFSIARSVQDSLKNTIRTITNNIK